ncbi:MAG TPA: ACP S-malonyltransferase [Dehalococcoidia bacterium]|nr:ACP S-malonyltransferase [Dehalococcoidia bacterium]
MSDVAWIFPGQGSQEPGMGRDVAEAFPAARDVFERADAVLGYALSRLCFEGPDEALRETERQQPAIFVTSLAILEAARSAHALPPARFVAGHSLGEYTALVAAGALAFDDGLRLVQTRGRLMQEAGAANPGAMAAIIGLDRAAVERVCAETGAELCNENAPSQIVIGGPPDVVERAIARAKEAGAQRAVPLPVSGAFHTSLMRPAAEGMARALEACAFRDPAIPVISNVTAKPLTKAEELRDELVTQLTSPVRWVDCVRVMAEGGARVFYEIGPGRVLAGLVRRIAPEATVVSLNGAAALRTASEANERV